MDGRDRTDRAGLIRRIRLTGLEQCSGPGRFTARSQAQRSIRSSWKECQPTRAANGKVLFFDAESVMHVEETAFESGGAFASC